MQMTKKITSIVLAVLMVVSMMSVMAVSTASAATNVASVGTTEYESLEAAIAAAPAGATVKLLADIDYSEVTKNRNAHDRGEELKIDLKDLTLDLNENTITTVNGSVVFTGNGATIKNGNFALNHINATGAFQNGSYGLCLDGYSVENSITLNDLTVEGGINIWDADVEINNVKATATDSNYYALWAEGNSNVTVNSGTFSDNGTAKARGPIATGTSEDEKGAKVTIKGGTFNATNKVVNGAEPGSIMIEGGSFTKPVPEEYCADGFDPKDNGNGTYTVETPYAAKIGSTMFNTLADAFAAAQDGDKITVLADCAGNGIKVTPAGKFANQGLTVDFNGHTYTVDGETVGSTGTETNGFQLLKNNNIAFKNGTITSAKAKILVQNYSNLELSNMTLTLDNPNYTQGYTLSDNNGIVTINDTTINANPAGGFAFDVCRFSNYPSVNVIVTGDSVINGDVEIDANKGDAIDGFSLTLVSGTMTGDIKLTANAAKAIAATPLKAGVVKNNTFTQEAPADYKWVDNNDGTSSLVAKKYVAQVGSTKYESLEEALAAISTVTSEYHSKSDLTINKYKANGTIKLLADCEGNGIAISSGSNLTIDFDRHTYNVNGDLVGSNGTESLGFQLLKDSVVTFKNGTITSAKAQMIIQNYSNLTLDNMTIDGRHMAGDGNYVLSNNNGNVVIKDTTINAREGCIAFDVCRYGKKDTYPSVNVTVKGDSVINGNVEVFATNSDAKDGFSLTLESGTLNGDIVVDPTAQTAMAADPDRAEVTKKNTFSQEAPLGYEWVDNGDGTSSIAPATYPLDKLITKANDGNQFGINSQYLKGTLLGVQKKDAMDSIDKIPGSADTSESGQETGKDIRFVAVLDTQLIRDLDDADDYGFVLAKVDLNHDYNNTGIENLKANWGNGEKTISAKNTYNNVCGNEAYGDPTDNNTSYKYVTCAVNGVDDSSKIVARFYYKKDGITYYAKYAGHDYKYRGCISTANAE